MKNEVGSQSHERAQREAAPVEGAALARELLRIQQRYVALPIVDDRSPDEILGYDDPGLPR